MFLHHGLTNRDMDVRYTLLKRKSFLCSFFHHEWEGGNCKIVIDTSVLRHSFQYILQMMSIYSIHHELWQQLKLIDILRSYNSVILVKKTKINLCKKFRYNLLGQWTWDVQGTVRVVTLEHRPPCFCSSFFILVCLFVPDSEPKPQDLVQGVLSRHSCQSQSPIRQWKI